MSPRFTFAAVLAAPLLFCSAALAEGEPISVKVNMARVLRVNSPAATVIVGNPGVADVTIQDPLTLVLTGKTYGQTNLIVLNNAGEPIADTIVEVSQDQADTVTVFNGASRTTLACASRCAPAIMLGDDPSYTENLSKSLGFVQGVQN